MNLKYYVLGTKDNPIILEYLDKFYVKLVGMLQDIASKGHLSEHIQELLSHDKHRKFILAGDISSMILVLHISLVEGKIYENIGKPEMYLELLEQQMQLFLTDQEEQLIFNKGEKIAGTEIRLSEYDYNPLSQIISHPGHKAMRVDRKWGDLTEEKWLESYSRSFEILKNIDEGIYDELNQIIGKIIPFGTADNCHNSCSHKDCIGHLYLGYNTSSTHPDVDNLEALIHESSHNKLNLIMQSEKIILNDMTEKYYSPYRPDARHINGVYIGIHAFVPVVYIMMKSYVQGHFGDEPRALSKIVLYYLKNKFTYRVLKKHGKFSPLGEEILDEVKYVMDLTDKVFLSIPDGKKILQEASERQKQHFMEVNRDYPHLEY